LIDYLRGQGPGYELLKRLRGSLGYRVTALSAFELALGRSYAKDLRPAEALLAVPCLPLSREAGMRAGQMLSLLRTERRGLDIRDALQAGICLAASAPLITRNARHFNRIPGLEVLEPDDERLR
jgi:tRNA(fMet)-specific endonuclease VapC